MTKPLEGVRILDFMHVQAGPVCTQLLASKEAVNLGLLLFGGATVVGNFAGGCLADEFGTRKAMIILLHRLIASLRTDAARRSP